MVPIVPPRFALTVGCSGRLAGTLNPQQKVVRLSVLEREGGGLLERGREGGLLERREGGVGLLERRGREGLFVGEEGEGGGCLLERRGREEVVCWRGGGGGFCVGNGVLFVGEGGKEMERRRIRRERERRKSRKWEGLVWVVQVHVG